MDRIAAETTNANLCVLVDHEAKAIQQFKELCAVVGVDSQITAIPDSRAFYTKLFEIIKDSKDVRTKQKELDLGILDEDLGKRVRKLPAELREYVWNYSLDSHCMGRTPDLVKGLRGDPLYGEVLKAWYAGSVVRLGFGHGQGSYKLKGIKAAVLPLVKRLMVDHCSSYPRISSNGLAPDITAVEDEKFHLAQNVTELILDYSNQRAHYTKIEVQDVKYDEQVKCYLEKFPKVQKITVRFVIARNGRRWWTNSLYNAHARDEAYKEIQRHLGPTFKGGMHDDEAIWVAEKGAVLVWDKPVKPATE